MSDAALLDKPMVVNWALAELGQAARFTIDDTSNLGRLVAVFWPRCVGHCFGLTDWTFCRQTFSLSRQSATPVTGYRYGFDLPGGRIGEPMRVLSDPRGQCLIRDKRIEGDTLYCDEPAAWAVCKVPVDVAAWDWQWANAFGVALAHFLCVPLTQDNEMAEAKYVIAFGSRSEGGTGGIFGRLIAQNRAADPVGQSVLASDPLTAGHYSPWHGRF